jgi:hypothetical protein
MRMALARFRKLLERSGITGERTSGRSQDNRDHEH